MKKIVIGAIVVIVLALGGWWLYNQNMNTPSETIVSTENQNQQNQIQPAKKNVVEASLTISQIHNVTYTDSGFSPQNLTIKAGDEVVWTNKSSGQMWIASAMHPLHADYSGINLQAHCPDLENNDFDQCKNEGPGTSWSFTFTKTGIWGYHNHSNSTKFGKITVE